jgi:hypothetical protein
VYVALTKEVLDLPLEEQPWFVGSISDTDRQALAAGNTKLIHIFYGGIINASLPLRVE